MLIDSDGTVIWDTNTNSQRGAMAETLETSNIILVNQSDMTIWQSFDSPTYTLLSTQNLTKDSRLVSLSAPNSYSSGYYNLHFSDNNVLYLIYNSPEFSSVYWPNPDLSVFDNGRTPYNSSRISSFDDMGVFVSSDNIGFNATDLGLGPRRRLTLDYDGMLRLYSLDDSNGLWKISWKVNIEPCRVHGICGSYGVCKYEPNPTCSCPSGFNMTDLIDWSKGCSSSFNLSCNPLNSKFVELQNTDLYGNDLIGFCSRISFKACQNSCLHDYECRGFGYALNGLGQCFPKRYRFNGYQLPNSRIIFHIKVPSKGSILMESAKLDPFDLSCSLTKITVGKELVGEDKKIGYVKLLIGFVIAVGIVEIICIGLGWWYVFRKHGKFTYTELKAATRNFEEELGKGGFGTVYKGFLVDGRIVAVKRLEGVSQGEAEFWVEVSSIGKINHMNLVKLWGFCAKG